jgi:hypothetical protein
LSVLHQRAPLRRLATQARDGAQGAIGDVAVVAGEHLLLQRLVEPNQGHDLGHAGSRHREVFGDLRLGLEGLVFKLRAVGTGAIEPQRAAFELLGIHIGLLDFRHQAKAA